MSDLDSDSIRRSFGRNAITYDKVSSLQMEIGQKLLAQLTHVTINPNLILDLGSGTGWANAALQQLFPQAHIIEMDFALPMLLLARSRIPTASYICADAVHIPLRYSTVDMIYSNAMLQWCNDLSQIFINLRQTLTTDGLLLFTTFGPATLSELRLAWSKVDNYPHVSTFLNVDSVKNFLSMAGFTRIQLHSELKHLTCSNVTELMVNLKTLGAKNAMRGRTKGLTGKGKFTAMLKAYEQLRVTNYLPITYEIIYGLAWNF